MPDVIYTGPDRSKSSKISQSSKSAFTRCVTTNVKKKNKMRCIIS